MAKFCTKCGTQLNEDANFCTKCGARKRIEQLYENTFNVAGVSFHEKELKIIIKNGVTTGNIQKFGGLSVKERREEFQPVGEYSDQEIEVTFNKTMFKNEEAIEVLADDFYGNNILIGYVPKSEVNDLLSFFDKNILIWATIVGGKQYHYGDTPEEDEVEELNLGIELLVKIFEQ